MKPFGRLLSSTSQIKYPLREDGVIITLLNILLPDTIQARVRHEQRSPTVLRSDTRRRTDCIIARQYIIRRSLLRRLIYCDNIYYYYYYHHQTHRELALRSRRRRRIR